jgi:hypothetical protein
VLLLLLMLPLLSRLLLLLLLPLPFLGTLAATVLLLLLHLLQDEAHLGDVSLLRYAAAESARYKKSARRKHTFRHPTFHCGVALASHTPHTNTPPTHT